LTRYFKEGRTLDGWDTLFRGLQAASKQEDLSAGTLINLTKRVDGQSDQELYGATPYKKRVKLNVGSPALDASYELTMAPLDAELGSTPEEMMQNLGTEWRGMVADMKTLMELVSGCRDVAKGMNEAVQQEFTEVDFELARLSNLLGRRSADMDPIPILGMIGDLMKEIAALATLRQVVGSTVGGRMCDPPDESKGELNTAGGLVDWKMRRSCWVAVPTVYSKEKWAPRKLTDVELGHVMDLPGDKVEGMTKERLD
jgi:hypothetical protein